MRTQFYVGLLGMLAGGLMGAAGCSDITAGQSSDPPGPPMLEHITVQDEAYTGTQRTSVTDLLDTAPPIVCSEIQPCLTQFIEAFHIPNFSCSCPTDPMTGTCMKGTTGMCNDPLKVPATGVPNFLPIPDPGDAGSGEQIRIVFSKLLNNSIESIAMDNTQPPGATNTYTLMSGIIELDGPNGMEVTPAPVYLYDNGGTPGIGTNLPSDLIQIPLGPALVIKPSSPLDPKTMYTIKMNTANLKDRQGNPAADAAGNPLPATYKISFTTEDITRHSSTSFPKAFVDATTMMPPVIAPNDVLTFAFWEIVDPTTVMGVTAMGPAGFKAANIEFFRNQAAASPPDPTKCKHATVSGATSSLRVGYTDGMGNLTDWPAGNYTLTFTIQDRHKVSTYDAAKLKIAFTVTGKDSDPTADTHALQNYLTPEMCTGM